MIEPLVNKVDKSLESEHFKNLSLSIQLSLDGFSFSVKNNDLNKIVALNEYFFGEVKHPVQLQEKIKKIFSENPLLNNNFREVKVTHSNQIFTLVPLALFNDDNLRDYLGFNHKLLESEILAFDILEEAEIAVVYSPFTEINDFLFDKFGEFTFMHSSSVLIESFSSINNGRKESKMYVNVSNKFFELAVLENKDLKLFNSFSYTTKEDFVYYILFVAEQLKMNPEEFELELYGNLETYSEIYELLYRYVRNVSFGNRNSKLKYTHELDSINKHNYLILFNH